jgi:energy-coupling factor transporter ATP-binding protein EcfA2
VVLQEPFLFRGTLWKNLVYGKPDAQPDEVIAAARAASAHDFILRQPLAYESPVGERGAGLSGGERQRLSIARAVLYDPKILILDEATSSVDTESEKAIQDALAEFTRGRTTVAIAHRLSTLKNADRIFVFDAGKLVEQGSHRQLVRLDGIYANLVRIQTRLGGEDSLERLIEAEKSTAVAVAETLPDEPEDEPEAPPRHEAKPTDDFWLDPCNCELRSDDRAGLTVATVDGEVYRGVTATRAFPASWPTKYLSLRAADADGKEKEIGVIRDLADWPAASRALLEAALVRQSNIREIRRIRRIDERNNFLYLDADTDLGRETVVNRWSQTTAIDFGEHGKLLTDVDDNLWVIRDVDALPSSERTLFRRYIYW